jgi:hypothetical protein
MIFWQFCVVVQSKLFFAFGKKILSCVINVIHSNVSILVFFTRLIFSFKLFIIKIFHFDFDFVFSYIHEDQNVSVMFTYFDIFFSFISFLFSNISSFVNSLNMKFFALIFIIISGVIFIYVLFTAK